MLEADSLTVGAGSTLGLIGMGTIGRETAKRARALGMRVLAVREHPEKGSDAAEQVVGFQDLDSILQQSDFVVLAAPLTAKTQHLMNRARLAQMKSTGFLINVSRGPLIDDDALVAALQQEQIAGAALDVFAEEPVPAGSPYWALENCLITPHTAAVTDKLWERGDRGADLCGQRGGRAYHGGCRECRGERRACLPVHPFGRCGRRAHPSGGRVCRP